MFDEHYEEIHRRENAANELRTTATTQTAVAKSAATAYANEEQAVFLYSVSHRGVPPIALSGKGAFRLYGAFATADEARQYAAAVTAYDPDISLLLSSMRDWCTVASTLARLADPDALGAKRDTDRKSVV